MSTKWLSVALRGLLYVLIAVMPIVTQGIQEKRVSIIIYLEAVVAGATALRAYIDGSAERHRQDVENKTLEIDPVP